MGLSWQGPLSPGAIGRFLVLEPLPKRLLHVERSRRRTRVRVGAFWIADSEDVLLLFGPGRAHIAPDSLQRTDSTTQHLGLTTWYTVQAGEKSAWQHIELPADASDLRGRIAFDIPQGYRTVAHYESDGSVLMPVDRETFCPCDIGDAHLAARPYPDAYSQVGRISNLASYEPDVVTAP